MQSNAHRLDPIVIGSIQWFKCYDCCLHFTCNAFCNLALQIKWQNWLNFQESALTWMQATTKELNHSYYSKHWLPLITTFHKVNYAKPDTWKMWILVYRVDRISRLSGTIVRHKTCPNDEQCTQYSCKLLKTDYITVNNKWVSWGTWTVFVLYSLAAGGTCCADPLGNEKIDWNYICCISYELNRLIELCNRKMMHLFDGKW